VASFFSEHSVVGKDYSSTVTEDVHKPFKRNCGQHIHVSNTTNTYIQIKATKVLHNKEIALTVEHSPMRHLQKNTNSNDTVHMLSVSYE